MTTWDTFMFNDELDILECRLYELEDVPDLIHVAVEADVDHQDRPKPYYLSDNLGRFSPWADRLRVVRASGLPTLRDDPGPWAREHAQREWVAAGLTDARPLDVVLHGDVDEIPDRIVGFEEPVAYVQQGRYLTVDWLHPEPWWGTVACHARDVTSFAGMRRLRYTASQVEGGWHLSWLGGPERIGKKVRSFCHPEFVAQIDEWLADPDLAAAGVHIDGQRMTRLSGPLPRWVMERRCPADWFS